MELEKALQQAKGSVELEVFKITPEHELLVKSLLNNEFSEE